ncbi:MAG: Hsp70 family protein [Propioniciclava sp.]
MSGWSLAIDFGTSNTAAAYARHDADGTVVVRSIALESDSTTMPSAVVAVDDGFVVGRAALNRAQLRPQEFIREPKRWVDAGSVPLGERDVPIAEIIGAVYAATRQRALEVAGGDEPDVVWLTHPQAWGGVQRRTLSEAAQIAGFAPQAIRYIAEPVAASHFYAAEATAPGTKMAVFDFGGGTCDVSVLEMRPDGTFGVLHSVGDNHLGGRDFDAALRDWAIDQLTSSGQSGIVAALEVPGAAQLTLLDSVRAAKEELSTRSSSFVAVSAAGTERELTITRDEYESLIAGLVGAATALVHSALDGARLSASDIDHVYLTGGSARTPAVVAALTRLFGKPLERLHDPKLVVSEGALRAPAREETGRLPAAAPASPALTAPPPTTPAIGHVPPPSGPTQTPPPLTPSYPAPPASAAFAAAPPPPGSYAGPGNPQRPQHRDRQSWSPHPAPGAQSGVAPSGRGRWYHGPLILIPILTVVAVITAGFLVITNLLTPAKTPTLEQCWDGSQVDSSVASCPPAPPVKCWDGSEVDRSVASCPRLEGTRALRWAFTFRGGDAVEPTSCSPHTDANPLVEEATVCQWDGMDGYYALILRYESNEAIKETYDPLAEASGSTVYYDLTNTRRWSFTLEGDRRFEALAYESIPFVVELVAGPEADPSHAELMWERVDYSWLPEVVDEVLATID